MGLLGSIFGSSNDKSSKEEIKKNINWVPLTSLEQLETIKQQSETEAIFIFKHSTRCGISSMVIKQFEKLFKEEHQKIKVFYLDLLSYRNISDEVGYAFQVMHQSPQLLVIRNGVSVHNASHYEITQTQISRFI
jgi:bacillithiol system protein YtxJ